MADFSTIVFFDLETTGLDTSADHIIQLAAVCGEKIFNAYIFPRREISDRAEELTGFNVSDGNLYLHDRRVGTMPLKKALISFISFLRSFQRPVLLAAHNGERFDVPILMRVLQRFSLKDQFLQVVSGFLDTLVVSRELYPQLWRHSQGFLVEHFLGKSFNAHNAVQDARVLQELFYSWELDSETIQDFIEWE